MNIIMVKYKIEIYEVPSEPGSGGPGFDVDVDDWDDVNVDIVL